MRILNLRQTLTVVASEEEWKELLRTGNLPCELQHPIIAKIRRTRKADRHSIRVQFTYRLEDLVRSVSLTMPGAILCRLNEPRTPLSQVFTDGQKTRSGLSTQSDRASARSK